MPASIQQEARETATVPRMILLAFLSPAHAFCGTYVGSSGEALVNRASRVVLAREGTTTSLTVAMDYEGSLTEFGLLLPVPEVLTADDVRVIEPTLLDRIEGWSEPRAVAYTCEDLVTETHDEGSVGCAFAAQDYELQKSDSTGQAGGVIVESSFSLAGYDIVVLSAEESAGLMSWLDTNGYAVPDGGEAILQEYLDGGSYFLAARVTYDLSQTSKWLPPLQFSYESDVFSLPIRIGTISADGPQEVLLYVLAESVVAISNYPELEVEDECMWKDDGEGFGAYYAAQLDEAFSAGAGWVSEYEWSLTTNCDPCTSQGGLTPEELEGLGRANYHGFLTRLRLRYSPEEATQDVVLYETNTGVEYANGEQIRFIAYDEHLEFAFPVCGEGWVEDPGQCDGGEATVGCGVPVGSGAAGGAGVLLALAAIRRRK